MEAAPFYGDLAEGPPGCKAVWLRADDGVRVRVGIWAGSARGTVFLLPGRCEPIEKYGRTAAALVARGYGALAVDWRGQGLSDRLLKNPDIGHVSRFTDYQLDLRACLELAGRRGLPKPWFMLAHSMGGAIGLRALIEDAPFCAAAFSAPMWGIVIAPRLRHLAATIPNIARSIGMGGRQAPTTGSANYFLETPFAGNFLTTDPDNWAYMTRQAAFHPRFRLGGPSLTWLAEALAETRALHVLPRPDTPAHVSVGTLEAIVDADAIERLTGTWDNADFVLVPDAQHEILMEIPPIRKAFLDRTDALFARVSA